MENVSNRMKIDFTKKDADQEIIEHQSKRTFNRIHKTYTKHDAHTFNQNEILIDKPIY